MIVVLFTTLIVVAAIPSNVTDVAPVKFMPVIVTLVPPAMPPDDGEMLLITGDVLYVKDENDALGPPPVVTTMPTAPALVRAGVIQVIVVLFTTLIDVADKPSNVTDVAPVKFMPVIVTLVPPAMPPDDGEMLLITGDVI